MNESFLREQMAMPTEFEWLEFKEAKSNLHFDELGRYFCALSNEANLCKKPSSWLIFGVTDKPPRQIVGTRYRDDSDGKGLESLKQEIAKKTNHEITFSQIHQLTVEGKRVLVFEIPAAPQGVPTTWDDTAYGRIGEKLRPLTIQKLEAIRLQEGQADWSAQICDAATIDDLDERAVQFAREKYAEKHPHLFDEVSNWDDATFLVKAKISKPNGITRAAIALLGKPESVHHLSPAVAKISWLLRDADGDTRDYYHFEPPFILAVDPLFDRIRNLTYRYLPDETLFPTEVSQYDSWVIREALHNCIAHMDYSTGGQITVIEDKDSLWFINLGEFIPGTIERVLVQNAPSDTYRNRCLAEAMVNFKMIDTIGSGIRRMFTSQRKRFFPMPEYDLSERRKIAVQIHGRVLDERYTRMLISQTELSLFDVVALDKVQKGKPLTDDEYRSMRRQKLVEGRRSNLRVSADVAALTETVVDYLNRRGIDSVYCQKMVIELLTTQGRATRSEFEDLLLGKLSEGLDPAQKKKFVDNLLQKMRRAGLIVTSGEKRGREPFWELIPGSPKASTEGGG